MYVYTYIIYCDVSPALLFLVDSLDFEAGCVGTAVGYGGARLSGVLKLP